MIRLNAKIERKFGNGCCEVILFTPCVSCVHLAFHRMSGRGFDALQKHFAPLQIQADERDARFLAGGNFFGREGER